MLDTALLASIAQHLMSGSTVGERWGKRLAFN